jgi:hypothetical protein
MSTPFDNLPPEVKARIEREAEEYGKKVRKYHVERMPAHFITREFPKWDGSSDFQAKSAYMHGATAEATRAMGLVEALKFYDSLRWRPMFLQWWPFTRSDKISWRATKALAAYRSASQGGKNE